MENRYNSGEFRSIIGDKYFRKLCNWVRRGVVDKPEKVGNRCYYSDKHIKQVERAKRLITTSELMNLSGLSEVQIGLLKKKNLIEYKKYGRESLYDISQVEVAKRENEALHHKILQIRDLSEEQKKFILENYRYMGGKKVAEALGLDQSHGRGSHLVRDFAMMNGLRYPHGTDVDHTFFDNMDNEYALYCYGLILTDGCVYYDLDENNNVVRGSWYITLNERDIGVLEKLKEAMHYKPYLQKDGDKSRNTATLGPISERMTNKLYHMGIVERKSYKDISNVWIPEDRKRFGWFMRGVIDGDGSVWCSDGSWFRESCKNRFYGEITLCQGLYNRNLMVRLQKILKDDYGIIAKGLLSEEEVERRGDHKYSFSIRGINFKKMYELIYDDPHVFIERKYKNGKKAYERQDFSAYIDWGEIYCYYKKKLKSLGLEKFNIKTINMKKESEMWNIDIANFLRSEGLYYKHHGKSEEYFRGIDDVVGYAIKERDRLGVKVLNRNNFSIAKACKMFDCINDKAVTHKLERAGVYETKRTKKG